MLRRLTVLSPQTTNPTNPAFAPTKQHLIEDTRMREDAGEFWTLCTCGEKFVTISAESLAVRYAAHVNQMKGN